MSVEGIQASESALERGTTGTALRELAIRALAANELPLLVINVALWIYLATHSKVFWTNRNIGVMLSSVSMVARITSNLADDGASNRRTSAGCVLDALIKHHPSSKIARTPSIVTNSRMRRVEAPTGCPASR